MTTQNQNAKLWEMVNKSSVEDVDRAVAKQNQAIRECTIKIKEVQAKAIHEVQEAHKKQCTAETEANVAKETQKKKSFLSFGLLSFTLLCCGIMNSQVVSDIIDFFKVITVVLFEVGFSYFNWIHNPYCHTSLGKLLYFKTGMSWFLRILTFVLILGCIYFLVALLKSLLKKYKKRWCTLSVKVISVSLVVITVFGKPIRTILPINLVLLLILTQIGYLGVLRYFDKYFDSRCRADDWKEIQNE